MIALREPSISHTRDPIRRRRAGALSYLSAAAPPPQTATAQERKELVMSKGWKRTLWIVGGLVLLLIVAIVVFVLTFDANKYKSEIAAAVNKATGRVLTIEGDIHLSIFPWLGAELGAMRLSNAPGFGDEPFAQIGAAAVKVKLLPLLRKEVEVDAVTLNGLRLSLRRDANGRTNWEDLAGKKAEEKPDTGAAGPVLASFALGGINLRDADIVWDDRAAATRYEISKLNLHTGPVTRDQPVRIDSDFDLASIQPALGAHVQLATQALYHFDSKRLELNGIELAAHVRNAALQDAEIKLAATALLELTAQHYQMRGLNVSADLKGDKLPCKHISAALAAAHARPRRHLRRRQTQGREIEIERHRNRSQGEEWPHRRTPPRRETVRRQLSRRSPPRRARQTVAALERRQLEQHRHRSSGARLSGKSPHRRHRQYHAATHEQRRERRRHTPRPRRQARLFIRRRPRRRRGAGREEPEGFTKI